MTIKYQALLAPIETQSTDDISITVDGYSAWAYSNTHDNSVHVFANVVHMVALLNNEAPAQLSFGFDSDMNVIVTASAEITDISTGTINTALGGLSVNGTSTVTASGVSPYSWVPRYRSSDSKWFQRESAQEFRGSRGVDGNLSGVSYTALQSRDLQWPYVKAENAIERANGASATKSLTSFEVAVNYSRSRMLKYESSGNINIKGMWLIDDISDYIGAGIGGASLETWENGTPNVGDPLWCSCAVPVVGGNSDPRLNIYYDDSVTLTATTAPTWADATTP